jgi:hypothetical protein
MNAATGEYRTIGPFGREDAILWRRMHAVRIATEYMARRSDDDHLVEHMRISSMDIAEKGWSIDATVHLARNRIVDEIRR